MHRRLELELQKLPEWCIRNQMKSGHRKLHGCAPGDDYNCLSSRSWDKTTGFTHCTSLERFLQQLGMRLSSLAGAQDMEWAGSPGPHWGYGRISPSPRHTTPVPWNLTHTLERPSLPSGMAVLQVRPSYPLTAITTLSNARDKRGKQTQLCQDSRGKGEAALKSRCNAFTGTSD